MARFIVRRLLGMVAVLFAVSVIVFLIFNVVPSTNPAQRLAGKNATPQLIKNIEEEWGFDESLPEQYLTMMKKIFTGELTSYEPQIPVDERIVEGIPATALAQHRRRRSSGSSFGLLFGYLSAIRAGGWLDRLLTGVAIAGDLDAGLLARPGAALLLHLQARTLPQRRVRAARRRPVANG